MTDTPTKKKAPPKARKPVARKAEPAKRAVPPKAKARRRSEPPVIDPDGASPGDWIEHSMSMEVRGPAGSLWLKSGINSQVRPDEDAQQAQDRVEKFVTAALNRKARAVIEGRA